MKFNNLFKGLWAIFFIPIVMAANITVSTVWPPKKAASQVEKPIVRKATSDSMTLGEARDIMFDARENASRTNKLAQPKDKKEERTKIVVRKVLYPVEVEKIKYKDTIYVSNGIGVEKPLVMYKESPKYGGDSVQKQSSFQSSDNNKKSGISKFFNSIFAKNKYKHDKIKDTTSKLKSETQLEHEEDSLGLNSN